MDKEGLPIEEFNSENSRLIEDNITVTNFCKFPTEIISKIFSHFPINLLTSFHLISFISLAYKLKSMVVYQKFLDHTSCSSNVDENFQFLRKPVLKGHYYALRKSKDPSKHD